MTENDRPTGGPDFDEGDGYPEEGPPGASGGSTGQESEARKGSQDHEAAERAPQTGDRTATGNPGAAGRTD